jgi:hypothetical protein
MVDDGLATGATMWAAVAAIRRQRPARVVVAVPLGAASTYQQLQQAADEVICATTPALFLAVGRPTATLRRRPTRRSVPCWTRPGQPTTTKLPVADRVTLPRSATGQRGK